MVKPPLDFYWKLQFFRFKQRTSDSLSSLGILGVNIIFSLFPQPFIVVASVVCWVKWLYALQPYFLIELRWVKVSYRLGEVPVLKI